MAPRWGRPLLVKKDTNFTHLVADQITGLDGATYTVLFIGTGRCGCAQGGAALAARATCLPAQLCPHFSRGWLAAQGREPGALGAPDRGAAGV